MFSSYTIKCEDHRSLVGMKFIPDKFANGRYFGVIEEKQNKVIYWFAPEELEEIVDAKKD